jgi:hypothetical protein
MNPRQRRGLLLIAVAVIGAVGVFSRCATTSPALAPRSAR